MSIRLASIPAMCSCIEGGVIWRGHHAPGNHQAHLENPYGILGSAIAATAFRRGERWSWWALLASNTLALVSAILYDKIVNAIGPFELTEYLGLALVWIACAARAPFGAPARPVPGTG
jgi:hypothetical protein